MLKTILKFCRPSAMSRQRLSTIPPRPFITHSISCEEHLKLLPPELLILVRNLIGDFNPRYYQLLAERKKTPVKTAELREDTEWIRNDKTWKGPDIVPELSKRWVEITGPAGDRKMMINALNSGAQIYMTDLEDSQSPEWVSLLQAYQNINDACKGTLSYTQKAAVPGASDKVYNVVTNPATMIVRPRGLHMLEKHIIDESGRPAPANLVDIVMYMFHNAKDLIAKGSRPLLYQPKLESFEEAVLVHDIIQQVEKHLGIPYGTTRVTALIETLPGLLQAEEIGFGLGKYWAGLNCGRWDYLFSLIKNNSNKPNTIYPDRDLLNMKTPFLLNYMMRVVQVCHSRGVHAMGGMSAFIPSKDIKKAQSVLLKVVADKEFEVQNGMDGAWVAHPGLVKDIQLVFEKGLKGSANQITSKVHLEAKISTSDLITLPKSLTDISMYTEAGLRNNISVGVLYIASWLGGNGAVAINGLMEDMATAEISRSQVWQWLKYKKEFTRFDGSVAALDIDTFREILAEEVLKQKEIIQSRAKPFQELCHNLNNLTNAAEIFKTLVQSTEIIPFIQDVAGDLLNQHVVKPKPLRTQFTAIKFSEDEKASLRGTRPEITLDARLAIIRGNNFNKVMSTLRSDGLVSHGSFIGTPNGHSARNVVEGGLGETWPYVGGWELNARGLNLGQPMPDTLSVSFHEQGELAQVINRFLEVADRVQELEVRTELAKIEKLPNEKQAAARERIISEKVDYLSSPMLADLEQGWGDPKKVFVSVIRCLQNGVNVMHIEDQYSLKRCGHLGGKGLDDVNGWKVIFKAANLAASLFHGVKLDGPNQNVNFVARTDALSAEFIQYSKHMHDVSHPDHPFIDWDRGFTPDGRYLYLKKGVNPATGKKYGLEHSAVRCAEIVKGGMASHVWMETPGADTSEAKEFMSLVNSHLAPHNMFARGLYNHSPSFVWDVSFFVEAQDIARNVALYIEKDIFPYLQNGSLHLGKASWMVQEYFKQNGDRSRGDYEFTADNLSQILANGIDLAKGELDWKQHLHQEMLHLKEIPPSLQSYKGQKEYKRILNNGFRPLRHITNVIGAQRLLNFKNKLSDAGFEIHLCTLPLYPSDAHTASELARGMTQVGIHDFVKKQRAARKYEDTTGRLTSFFHQKATGTGWEVNINKIVGTSNTAILEGSTEVADHAKEQSLRDKNTGPSTYHP